MQYWRRGGLASKLLNAYRSQTSLVLTNLLNTLRDRVVSSLCSERWENHLTSLTKRESQRKRLFVLGHR